MAFDLDQLQEDAQVANDKVSAVLVAIRGFINGKVAGQSYTAGQRNALKAQFAADVREVELAVGAIVAQLDAN